MLDDFRTAWRRLRHSPGFAFAAIVTLAFAVGANTAILTIADAVLFRPLPYSNPDSVFVLQMMNRETGGRSTSIRNDLLRIVDQQHQGLGAVAVLESGPRIIASTPDGPETVPAVSVTANYFALLGVSPARGRLFEPVDTPGTAVLSYSAWRQRFGSDKSIVGRAITLGSATYDIVGVLPREFLFPSAFAGKPEIVVLMAMPASGGTFHPITRLEAGVLRERAQAELEALAISFASDARFVPVLEDVRSVLYPVGRPMMGLLLVGAVLVLLIGCSNLANMLLARGQQREREIGVRTALGARAIRLVRPLLIEALIVGLAAALLAIGIGSIAFDLLLPHVPPLAYRNAPVGVDARVVGATLFLGVLGGLAFAVLPAWRLTRIDTQLLLQGTRRAEAARSPFGRLLIVIQVALALILVFGSLVTAKAFFAKLRIDLGFNPDNVVIATIPPPEGDPLVVDAARKGDRDAVRALGLAQQEFYVQALEMLSARGDVAAVGAASSIPLDLSLPQVGIVGPSGPKTVAGLIDVLPGFFESAGITLIRGRFLSRDDLRADAPGSVVSESAARALFAGEDALGRTFESKDGRRFIVIGVVGDSVSSLDSAGAPLVYAIPGATIGSMKLVVRFRSRHEAALSEVKRVLSAVAPTMPVRTTWWDDNISGLTAYRNPRFQTIILGTFASLALTLTALGIFAVVAFLVGARTREFGIRLALGGSQASLVALAFRQALIPVAAGIVLGLVGTRGLARLAEAQLFAVDTRDLATLGASAGTVIFAATLAAFLPARRAALVDPAITLRTDG